MANNYDSVDFFVLFYVIINENFTKYFLTRYFHAVNLKIKEFYNQLKY